jgi:hypothetical protein
MSTFTKQMMVALALLALPALAGAKELKLSPYERGKIASQLNKHFKVKASSPWGYNAKCVTGTKRDVTPPLLMDVTRFAGKFSAVPKSKIGGCFGECQISSGWGPGGKIMTWVGPVTVKGLYRGGLPRGQ